MEAIYNKYYIDDGNRTAVVQTSVTVSHSCCTNGGTMTYLTIMNCLIDTTLLKHYYISAIFYDYHLEHLLENETLNGVAILMAFYAKNVVIFLFVIAFFI